MTARLRAVTMALVLVSGAILAVVGSPEPAAAGNAESVQIGMPFSGKWAYNVLTTAGCGSGSNQTAHPSCHELYGYHWSVDVYASDGTDVKLQLSNPTGALTYEFVEKADGSCGHRFAIKVKVDATWVGEIYFEHLKNEITSQAALNTAMSTGGVVGKVDVECHEGPPAFPHAHLGVRNISPSAGYACYVNHSTASHTAGMDLSEGTALGWLGADGTGVQQACSGSQPGLQPGGGVGTDYAVAFNSGNLWLYGPSIGTINTGLGMMPGTSPAITKLANGGYQVAFVANTGRLWVYGAAGSSDTGLGVASGTSPDITAVGNGFQVAFNSGNLWVYGTVATANTGFGMAPGTSPAITAAGSNNYQVAFNSGNMWLYGITTANTGFGMSSGTSPAITTTPSGTEAAFNGGNLWMYGAIVTANTGFGVASGTSPAITTVGTTYQAAFNSGNLWLYGPLVTANTGFGMMPGTSPAITAVAGGTEVAFVSNAGHLWVYGSVATSNTGLGVASSTSPSIAS